MPFARRHVAGAERSKQDALEEGRTGAQIRIVPDYEPSVEPLPIRVDRTGVQIRGTRRGPAGRATVHDDTGEHLFHPDPGIGAPGSRSATRTSAGRAGAAPCASMSRSSLFADVDVDAERVGRTTRGSSGR